MKPINSQFGLQSLFQLILLRRNSNFFSIKGELVERQYHFDVPDVPQGTSKFIELIYGYDQPAFDAKVLTGMK